MLTNRFYSTIAERNPIMMLILSVLVSLCSALPARSQMLELPPTYDQENKVYRLFTDDNKSFTPVPMCDGYDYSSIMPNRLIVQQLKLYGVMDLLGNVIAPFMYDEIRFCRGIECFAVRQRNQLALMGKNGNLLTDFRYNLILASEFREGYGLVREETLVGMIDSTGKEVLPLQFLNIKISRHPSSGVWLSKETAEGIRWGKMLPNGTVLKPFVYDSVDVVEAPRRDGAPWDGEYVVAKRDGKWGIEANLAGSSTANVVVPFEYENIATFDSDKLLFSVQQSAARGAKWGMLTITSHPTPGTSSPTHRYAITIPFAFNAPFEYCYSEQMTIFGAKKETGWGIVDSTGRQMLAFLFDETPTLEADNRYSVKLRGVSMITTSTGTIISPSGYDGCEWLTARQVSRNGIYENVGLIKSKRGNKYGLHSSTGSLLLEPTAENKLYFHSSGLAYIRKTASSPGAYINTQGTILTDFIYDEPSWLEIVEQSGSLRKIHIGSLWGVINSDGKEVVPPEYERVWIFEGGKTFFAKQTPEKGSKWSYFSHTGTPFYSDKYDSVRGYTTYRTLVQRNGKWGIMCDTTAQEIVPPTYDSVDMGYKSTTMRAWRGNTVCLVNTSTEREITAYYDFVADKYKYGGAIRVRRGGKWGLVSADSLTLGQEIVPPRYDYICEAQNGFAQVRMGTKYGYVALTGSDAGKEVVRPEYDIATAANENGEVLVLKGGVEIRLQLPMQKKISVKNP